MLQGPQQGRRRYSLLKEGKVRASLAEAQRSCLKLKCLVVIVSLCNFLPSRLSQSILRVLQNSSLLATMQVFAPS